MSIIAQWNLTREGVTASVRATIVGLAVAEHVPFLVGAVLMLFGQQAGLWGLVVGVVMVVIASMVNAWVLLIEVRR
jgi:modulator of FtsH protease